MVLRLFKRKSSRKDATREQVAEAPSFRAKSRTEASVSLSSRRSTFKTTPRTLSDETTSSEVSGTSITSLLEIQAREGNWPAFLKLVTKSTLSDWDPSPVSSETKTFPSNTATPLHIALAHRPTLEVVESLIQILKEKFNVEVPEEFKDSMGRTPLHVGAIYHCNEKVAERLLNGDNLLMPAVLRDNMERTPLHLATCSPILKPEKKSFFGKNQMAEDRWNKRCLVFMLLEHYPEAATLTDSSGKTPWEYGRENKLGESSLSFIQRMEKMYQTDEKAGKALSSTKGIESMQSELAKSDIPFVLSANNSWNSFCNSTPSKSVKASALLGDMDVEDHAGCKDDQIIEDGVSSLGYNEAEMFNLNDFDS